MKIITKDEWIAKGEELFGKDQFKWRFVCPGCGQIQSPEDFRQYRGNGASPASAYRECIGRYSGGRSWAFDKPGQPCDYAAYGLLNICPVRVKDGDSEISCFAFDGDKDLEQDGENEQNND